MKVYILFLFLFSSLVSASSCPELEGFYAHCISEAGHINSSSNLTINRSHDSGIVTYSYEEFYDAIEVLSVGTFYADDTVRTLIDHNPHPDAKTEYKAKCEDQKLIVESVTYKGVSVLSWMVRTFERENDSLKISYETAVFGTKCLDIVHCK